MASRFPCPHETWANKRAAAARARETRNEPPVMGPTPHCPWCAHDSGKEMANQIGKAIFADEIKRVLARALKEHASMRAAKAVQNDVEFAIELLLKKDQNANGGPG